MRYSRYNIFSKIRDSENYFLINLLSGNADILDVTEAGKLAVIRDGENISDEELYRLLTKRDICRKRLRSRKSTESDILIS